MRASVKRRIRRIFRHIVKGKIFTGSEEYFMENGKLLLEERISLFHGKTNPIRCFSIDELNDMITKVNHDLSAEFKWYDGNVDGRPVLIKVDNDHHYGCLLRETAIAAQMSTHKNALKLLGCCLETQYPVLVYESDVHSECLRVKLKNRSLGWKDRLRIAWEISHSVAYLHSAFPRPIVHRNLKPSQVLLDMHNSAKLYGFNLSVSLPEGKPYLCEFVIGTLFNVAPEYGRHGKVSQKSDVYSFGVLFLQLITGEPLRLDLIERMEADSELDSSAGECTQSPGWPEVMFLSEKQVSKWLESKHISKIFDPIEKNGTQAAAVASNEDIFIQQFKESVQLLFRCIAMDPESRPTMEEVASELKHIIAVSYESHVLTTNTCSTMESEDLSNEAQGMECITEESLLVEQSRCTTNQEHEMGYDGSSKSLVAKGRILAAAIPLLLFSLIFVPLLSVFYG